VGRKEERRKKAWSSTAMGTSMRGNFTRESVMDVGFIITLLMEGMKGIGWMGDMMGMGLKAGLGGVDIEGSTELD